LEHGDEYAFVSHGDDLSASLRLGRAPDPESLSPTLRERRNRESPLSMEPRRGLRAVILIAGLALCQAVLYGESLLGQKILLPLDLLARHNYYLPAGHDLAGTPSHNPGLSDRLLQYEPERRFAASELRAGRVPQWNPYGFAGAPLGSLTTYSPFNLIYYLFPHPVALAWLEFCVALAAGLGTHLFFRRVIGVGFWPAAIGAWVFPLSGFFALWQGFSMLHAVAWLPWVLLGTDAAVRNPKGWGGPGLALASACAMSGGQLAMQVLLASGLFGVWRTIEQYGWRLRPPVFRVVAVLTVAWAAGVMLATPDWLHLRDYSHASARMIDRADGLEDRPPVGLSAIPQVVLPDIFGSYQTGHFRIVEGNRLESSAAAYVGLLAVLVLVPIGLADRRRRGMNGMWLGLTLLSPQPLGVHRILQPARHCGGGTRSAAPRCISPSHMVSDSGAVAARCEPLLRVSGVESPRIGRDPPTRVQRRARAVGSARLQDRSPRSGQLSREHDAGPRALSDRARALGLVGAFARSGRDGAVARCADGGRAALVWQGPESTDGPGTLLPPCSGPHRD
jgi:hypothetical protein